MENENETQENTPPALLQQLESVGLGAETLAALAADLDQVKTAALELPALLELNARCSLARRFIYCRPSPQANTPPAFQFDAKAFEGAWAYLCGGDEPASHAGS